MNASVVTPLSLPFDSHVFIVEDNAPKQEEQQGRQRNQTPQNATHTVDFHPLLPAACRAQDLSGQMQLPTASLSFLQRQLGVNRLNQLHNILYIIAQAMPPHPLHRQKLFGRAIMVTEDVAMHLVYYSNMILIKPMPRYLL